MLAEVNPQHKTDKKNSPDKLNFAFQLRQNSPKV